MAVFTVNGQKVEPTGNQKLLRFLRDELHLTSVKDGCSEGACGACTVIIDGKTCKACVPDTDLLDGRTVITVEGLTEWEREVYTYAYGKAGAVQCGFCIPGMVMCTKALLDVNKEPTDDEIKYALRNNYCRCTAKWFWFAIGYQCCLAYIVSLCIYQFGTLFTGGGFGLWTVVAVVLLIAFLYMLFRPYKESKSLKVA